MTDTAHPSRRQSITSTVSFAELRRRSERVLSTWRSGGRPSACYDVVAVPFTRTTHRKLTWHVDVSTGSGNRAAGR